MERGTAIPAERRDVAVAAPAAIAPEHFGPVLAHAGIGIWSVDTASGALEVDPTAASILGGTPATFDELLERLAPEEREGARLRIELCGGTGTPMDRACRLLPVDGESDWIRLTACRTAAPQDELRIRGTVQNISGTKRMAEALRASEARFATLFDQSLVGVLHRDRDLNVLMVNDRFLEIVGRTADALTGLPARDFTHPDDVAGNDEVLRRHAGRGEPFTVEKRYLRPDGTAVWCEVNVAFVPDENGDWGSTITVIHDISGRKAAEEERQRVGDMLQLALESAGAGVWETDLEGRLRLSPTACRIYGLPEGHSGELTHEEWSQLVDPDSIETMERSFRIFCEKHEPHSTEFKIRRPDGKVRWLRILGRADLDENGVPCKIVGLIHDDTERKRSEEELRESEAHMRLVQEAALIGTFVTYSDGTAWGSQQFFRNLGLPEDTVYIDRKSRFELIHPQDRARVMREITAATESGEIRDCEYRIRRRDTGEERWILARVRPEVGGGVWRIVGAHLDITDAKQAAAALQQSESLNQAIVDASADAIGLLDRDGMLRFMNRSGLRDLELCDPAGGDAAPWASLWPLAARPKVEAALALARADKPGRFSVERPCNDGSTKWWDVIVTPLSGGRRESGQLLSICRDVTQQRRHAERVRWAADHDSLTGLPNRNYFQEQLGRILCEADQSGSRVGLLALDVDNFKQVNDLFGHDAGDALLRTIAERLQPILGACDVAARLGGDEFAILLPKLSERGELIAVAGSVLEGLREPFVHQGCVMDCRVSIGAAAFPDHGDCPDQLMKNADTALYAAKSEGRGRALQFDPGMRSELDRRTEMMGFARRALETDDVVPFYQPQVDLRTGKVAGFEALLRWRDPTGAIRAPAAIAAAFEDLDVAKALSARMQERVIADIRDWLDRGIDFGSIAINAAAAEFRRNDFAERLLGTLDDAGVPPCCVELEITETVFLGRGADHVGRALELLSGAGMRIALDDFGTGYASLLHLKDFPVDVIKLDRSFVAELGRDESDTAIVLALLNLAEDLKIRTVAEGIETRRQAKFLAARGCDFGQGFLFGRPVEAARVPALVATAGCAMLGR